MKDLKSKVARLISYICMSAVCVLISGCDAKETSVTSAPAISEVTSTPAISSSEGAVIAIDQKEGTGKDKWLPEKITPITASDWEKAVDENKRYVFILKEEKTIIQIDKKTRKCTPIVQCKKKDTIYFLIVEEDNLYYQLNDDAIYQYNLLTGKTKQIYHTEKEPDSIFGVYIYKKKVYLYRGGLIISKLDLKTKKQEELLEVVLNPVFVDNELFFMKKRDKITIYGLNLDTGKTRVVRKSGNIRKKRFHDLFQYRGKLCYAVSGEQWQICMLSEQEKDIVLVSLKPDSKGDIFDDYPRYVYSRDKDVLYYVYKRGDNDYLGFCKNGRKRKIQLPEDYLEQGCVCDGYFFYQGEEDEKYYCAYVNIKDEQLKRK